MKSKLKKDYFSQPKGTIVNVLLNGTDGYKIQNALTKDIFMFIKTKEELLEWIEN
jgi:hypothetical protein